MQLPGVDQGKIDQLGEQAPLLLFAPNAYSVVVDGLVRKINSTHANVISLEQLRLRNCGHSFLFRGLSLHSARRTDGVVICSHNNNAVAFPLHEQDFVFGVETAVMVSPGVLLHFLFV